MPKSEPQEPEKNSVADEKTVDNAEEELAVAEDSDGGVGIVVAVDEGEAIEDEHNGGGEAVVLWRSMARQKRPPVSMGMEKCRRGRRTVALKEKVPFWRFVLR